MLSPLRITALLGALLLGLSGRGVAADIDAATYGYPLTNPFEATITSTPLELQPLLPTDLEIDQKDYSINLRPEREY